MEPVDYLKILKSHWKIVAALVVVAVGAVFLASPSEASRSYGAEHVLRLASSSGEDGSTTLDNVQLAARVIRTGEVPARAAELLQWDDSGAGIEELADKVEVLPDSEVGTVTVTATDQDPNEAVDIANAFGVAWIEYVDEHEEERRSQAAGSSDRIVEIQDRLAAIATALDAQPPPPNAEDLRVEQLELELELENEVEAQREDAASSANTVVYETLTEARSASAESSLFASREQRMALAAGVAALLGFGVAMVLDRNDSRVRTKEQAERRFGLPVLAEVPILPLRDRSKAAVVAYEREPRMAEAYRSLRTALLLFRAGDADSHGAPHTNGNGSFDASPRGRDTGGGTQRQVLVVTSPEPGEGKSTTAANLALAYAEAGHSALILTWDLWRPLSPSVFGAADGPGVTDYLNDPRPALIRYVQDTAVPGVSIVTAGVTGGGPSPRSDTMRRLLEDARTLADVVVVDTAPILSASVTRELASLADAVLLVCRVGRTTSDAGDRCAELMERIAAPALGVVMVGVPATSFTDYYGPARKAGYDRVAGPRRRTALAGAESAEPADPPDAPPDWGNEGRHLRPGGDQPYRTTIPASDPRSSEGRERRR